MLEQLFEIRELNFVVEVYSTILCILGAVCLALMLPRSENRRIAFQLYLCAILLCAGDAMAALGRGQEGALAWAAVHVGNFLAFTAPQVSFAFLATHLSKVFASSGLLLRWWKWAAWAMAVFAAVFVAFGGAYSIDAGNLYSRASGFWVMSVTVIVMAIGNLVVVLRHRDEVGRRTLFVYVTFSVLPIAAAVVQPFIIGLNVAVIAQMLCLMVLFYDATATAAEESAAVRERVAIRDKELAEARLATVTSQIRPHFIFNTLDGIYYLIAEDPKRAQEAIDEFSTYLRTNLESLEQVAVVPIEKELSNVQTYLGLEKMSMEHLLEFEIDMQATGFSVPVLSVQTLAENAVKHGVSKRVGGGRVVVRTKEDADCFLVTVEDNGVGFDVANAGGEGHIGLENTRMRLDAMCGGKLDVESVPGEGAIVTMRIPKDDGGLKP